VEQRVLPNPGAFARVAITPRFPTYIPASFTSRASNVLHKLNASLLNSLIEQSVFDSHVNTHLDVFPVEIHLINFLLFFLFPTLIALSFVPPLSPFLEHIIKLFICEIVVFFVPLLAPLSLAALNLLGVEALFLGPIAA